MVTFAWVVSVLAVGVVGLRRLPARWASIYMGATLVTLAVTTFTYTVRPFPPAYEAALVGLAWFVAVLVAPVQPSCCGVSRWLCWACGWRWLGDSSMTGRWMMPTSRTGTPGTLCTVMGWFTTPAKCLWKGTQTSSGRLLPPFYRARVSSRRGHAGCDRGLLDWYSGVGLCACLSHACSHISQSRCAGVVCALLLVVDPSFVTYGVKGSGIEAVPFAFLVLLAIVLLWWRDAATLRPYLNLLAGGFALGSGFAYAA